MKKLLPIKFIEKRKADEQLTEAGGGKDLPKWVMHGEELAQRSTHLVEGLTQIAKEFKARLTENHSLPIVMATAITDKAIAKTHRGAIVDLLNSDNNPNVIGVDSVKPIKPVVIDEENNLNTDDEGTSETRRLLSIVNTGELLGSIDLAIKDIQNNAKLISSIESIELFKAKNGGFNPNNKMYHVRLLDFQDHTRNIFAQNLFKANCENAGITIDKETRYSSDMRIYRITLDSIDEMETVLGFEGVFSIEEAIPIRISMDSLDDICVPVVKHPKADVLYPVVGVLDSGIKKNAYLSPWIMEAHETYYEERLQDKNHGSMVASVLEYSDEINGTDYTILDGIMMFEAIVTPDLKKEAIYPDDLIDNIRDTIERHKDIKIWTMSAGTIEESDLNTFSEYGIALDNIADENDVLIIKSAGNSTAFARREQMERIAKMADSVRSLVVGSIAGEKSIYDFADVGMPSPFTRIGPGPGYIVKPDLVAYGGNAGIRPDGKVTTTGIKVLDSEGRPARTPGTSFSTPWVARIAAELNHMIDGKFDPLLIKALLVHNATYPLETHLKLEDKITYMGFGMPSGTRDILYNSENEITLILRDKLQKGYYIDVLDFPFPQSMIEEDGLYHGQIILTMVSAPILRAAEGPEYCQSNIQVAFGTMEGIKERDTTKKTIRNPYGAENAANIMRDRLYKRQFFDVFENDEFARERTLLHFGKKFHPIKKYAINLDEMTDANKRKYLDGNRKWYMKVESLFRDTIERETGETGEILEQDFCILLTIRDSSGRAPVYNEVTQQLEEKGFVFSNIQLKYEIREYVHADEENEK